VLLAIAGSLLLWVSAKVQVPFWPVPMTMQTFVVLGLGAAFGWRLGMATVALYLLAGRAWPAGVCRYPGKGHRPCLHGRSDRWLSCRLCAGRRHYRLAG
jgi:biotin transport system substrate-specific component